LVESIQWKEEINFVVGRETTESVTSKAGALQLLKALVA
jgi:hypothetical protein